ncbi:alpha/beta fold hydrolase [Roseiarcus sp.]|uniref:alpha/beta fold hydrolase n=1 Tax=Roseiarcus sp. TaxID=1969460 RepID=UPI003F9B35AE
MSGDRQTGTRSTDEASEQAARHTLALNPIVGFRRSDLVESAGIFFKAMIKEPQVAADQWLAFVGELGDILRGASERSPAPADKRFADPTWKSSPLHRGLLKAYLAWGEALDGFVDRTSLGKVEKERAHLFATILIDALAPTNSLLANPAAARRLLETGGQSLLSGLSNYLDDLIKNGGLPSQVDMSAFKVGENLATTPGGVVFRNDLIELIQYEPTTAAVAKRPLVITPPQINKFYALDLSPEKSLIRFLLKNGIQIFAVSWRNPTVQHRDWGLDTYVAALDEAVDAARRISGSEDVTMMGSCSGGITACAYASTLGLDKIKNLVLAVCLLDTKTADDSAFGSLITPETMLAAKEASRLRGVLDGQDLARMFAWMRPNDLIWNYWVNNYLLGNAPPAFDILFWNADTTRLPARLHGDYLDLYATNPFVNAGKLFLNKRPVDMNKVKGRVDAFVVGGVTDHITPWKSVFQTARILGDDARFILSNSGHLQSLINPPGARKASFRVGSATAGGPDAFLSEAEQREGSWWLDWVDWLRPRAGPSVDAPKSLGDDAHPVLAPAPGSYVFER